MGTLEGQKVGFRAAGRLVPQCCFRALEHFEFKQGRRRCEELWRLGFGLNCQRFLVFRANPELFKFTVPKP